MKQVERFPYPENRIFEQPWLRTRLNPSQQAILAQLLTISGSTISMESYVYALQGQFPYEKAMGQRSRSYSPSQNNNFPSATLPR
eukprot:4442050-Pyramimonas_sp.AAC.1